MALIRDKYSSHVSVPGKLEIICSYVLKLLSSFNRSSKYNILAAIALELCNGLFAAWRGGTEKRVQKLLMLVIFGMFLQF